MNKYRTQSGRVVANFGPRLLVQANDGSLHRCVALKKLGLVVTGDLVDWKSERTGDARVINIQSRQSLLERPDRRGQRKAIAANLTRLIIVCAIKPGVETLLIDQYCAAAELADITPIVVVNKSDLLSEQSRQSLERDIAIYKTIGYEVAFIQTLDHSGILPLIELISDQVSMLVGQSGVGKSSIVKQLFPDLDIRVGALSEASGSGAHTTTVSNWYDLDDGGALIDSPGVRQFSLEHLSQADLAIGFREIKQASFHCKFNNCTHLHEPQCQVLNEIKLGAISQQRYDNYKKLVSQSLLVR